MKNLLPFFFIFSASIILADKPDEHISHDHSHMDHDHEMMENQSMHHKVSSIPLEL